MVLKTSKKEWVEREDYRKKILYTENDLNCEGAKVQLVEVEPANEVDPHYHKKQTEVFNIQKGEGIIIIENKKHEVEHGDTLLCKPNQTHQVKNQSGDPLRILVLKTNYDYEEEDTYWEKKSDER